jgi:hypothetical protein
MNKGYISFRRIREIKRAKERAEKVQLTSRFKLSGKNLGPEVARNRAQPQSPKG